MRGTEAHIYVLLRLFGTMSFADRFFLVVSMLVFALIVVGVILSVVL